MMKTPAGTTYAESFGVTPLGLTGAVDSILLGDAGFVGNAEHAMSMQAADEVLLADDAPLLDATALSDAVEPTPQAYIFDGNSGFWVVDDAGPDAIVLDLGEDAAVPQLDWREERMAA
jgi:hypothetical protein